jgi:ribonuclease Z
LTDALYLLGAGTPTPTISRFGTSYVLQLGEEYLMIDCGPASTYNLVKAGLFPTQIDYLFITHHHFDHNADLPCLLLCRWDQSTDEDNELRIWGPQPTEQIVDQLVGPDGAFSHDWKARVSAPLSQAVHANRGGSLPRPKPSFEVVDLGAGQVVEESSFTVTTAHACHVAPWLDSLAYRVRTEDGSIVFAGDTEPCQSVADLARTANIWDKPVPWTQLRWQPELRLRR